jgi:YD repeat-containing protein
MTEKDHNVVDETNPARYIRYEYDIYGRLMRETQYINAVKDGLEIVWGGGKRRYQTSWKNGLKDGQALEWYESGRPSYSASFVAGLKQGLKQCWYIDGNVQSLGNYKDDYLDGVFIDFHENGKMRYLGYYHRGSPRCAISFAENGKMQWKRYKIGEFEKTIWGGRSNGSSLSEMGFNIGVVTGFAHKDELSYIKITLPFEDIVSFGR